MIAFGNVLATSRLSSVTSGMMACLVDPLAPVDFIKYLRESTNVRTVFRLTLLSASFCFYAGIPYEVRRLKYDSLQIGSNSEVGFTLSTV